MSCKIIFFFPSISDYFHIPIIFDFLDFHCPFEVFNWNNFFFLTLEHFFSNMDFFNFYLKAFKWKSLSDRVLLSSTKIEVEKVERLPWPGTEPGSFRSEDERSTNELVILLIFANKNSYFIYLYRRYRGDHVRRCTIGQIHQKCKET